MNRRIQWIQYKGKRIFQVDARALTREDQLELGSAYSTLLAPEPDASVLLLVLASSFEFHPDVVNKVKTHLLAGQPKVLRSALVGVDGMFKIAIEGFITLARFLGMTMNQDRGKHFENEEEAKDWLVR